MKNFYKILEVDHHATIEEVEKARDEKLKEISTGIAEKDFSILGLPSGSNIKLLLKVATNRRDDIKKAYTILSDWQKRDEYEALRQQNDTQNQKKSSSILKVVILIVLYLILMGIIAVKLLAIPERSIQITSTISQSDLEQAARALGLKQKSKQDEANVILLNKRADKLRTGRQQTVEIHKKCVSLYQKVLTIDPSNEHALYWLGYSLFHSEQHHAAIQALNHLLTQYPDHSKGQETRQEFMAFIKQYPELSK